MKIYSRFFFFFICLALASGAYARSVEQTSFKFKIDPTPLLRGDIHYSYQLISPKQLVEKFPEALDLDSLSLVYEKKIRVLLTKSVMVVKKPVEFFGTDHMKDEKFVRELLGAERLEKQGEESFKVTQPGDTKFSYVMRTYFDSDEISTLSSSKVVQAVAGVKKMEVMTQGASSHVLREYNQFPKGILGATAVTSHVPLAENKTLVITYQITVLKKNQVREKELKTAFLQEAQVVQSVLNSFKK